MADLAPNADRYPPISAERMASWEKWPNDLGRTYFPGVVGLELEEIRTGYARMRLRYRPELEQPAGVVHGGAVATLIDTVVVPAISCFYDRPLERMLTLHMGVDYLAAVVGQDAIAEGFVLRGGGTAAFCRAEVRIPDGTLVATGDLVYQVRLAPKA